MTKAKCELPLLPLRDIVVFPYMVVPLFVGRERSINAVEAVAEGRREILLLTQREPRTNDPKLDQLYGVGTLCTLLRVVEHDGVMKVLVEGIRRVQVDAIRYLDGYSVAEVSEFEQLGKEDVEIEALVRSLQAGFESYVKVNRRIPPEMLTSVTSIEQPSRLVDTIAAQLTLKLEQKQRLLEVPSLRERLELLYQLMTDETEILRVERRIRSRVKQQMERSQKEYYLNEKMQAIQKELGGQDEFTSEFDELSARAANVQMSAEARKRVESELRKLKLMPPISAEATVTRNYIDWILDLPWEVSSEITKDLAKAREILDADHYGLQKIKERIVEYLAVQSLVESPKAPILCLGGPPGVGKTSLGKSIARATGREFVRLSLGGVRDEAEIRGHRRTYIGALPGKIIQSLKKAKTNNPVFLLDEVDKMTSDFRGDPAAALLEVLDPEQNNTFNDHYLDLDFDLSKVMFVTTANDVRAIPLPLQDRMEVIELPGYTDSEKLAIARRYLLPRQLKGNGLDGCVVQISDGALKKIIGSYTREAGVRELERNVSAICRKLARKRVDAPDRKRFRITADAVGAMLGVTKHVHNTTQDNDYIGTVNGLAVTYHGGDLLVTEVAVVPGKGKLELTGKLGDVMRESAHAALTYVRSRSISLGLDPHFYRHVDLHVHCPEGAIPKDGPSAGTAIATAMVSALLRIPVRRDIAMTGEITLGGRVLPIGGLKAKLLAARRAGAVDVIIPAQNEKDLAEISPSDYRGLTIHTIAHVDDVLRLALRLAEPQHFLSEPSELVDWRSTLASSPTPH